MQEEIWKDVKGFEGIYMVSNKGRLLSKAKGDLRILSTKNSKGDYIRVAFRTKNKTKTFSLHKLVYEAFKGETPKGGGFAIHHKDGNKQNNCIDNLELLTHKEHCIIHLSSSDGIRKVRNKKTSEADRYILSIPHKGVHPNLYGMINYNKYIKTKKVSQFDLNGNFIKTYLNGKDASDATGVCQRNILQVANKEPFNKKGNIRKQAGGFIWRFAE